ncbi:DNA cytosine methyltransferase [Kineococcus sp. SYSU DK003]|uniref:DNA cytosine methyltransferase n=1 Tax=Kineococcus sp. SYSU DK003 TaxID=3383124 RepID=UPI003D7EC5F3
MDVVQLAALASVEHPRRTYAATGGIRATDQQVRDLVGELRSVAADLGYPDVGTDDRSRIAFDRAAAEVVHRRVRVNTVEAANNEVWNFLGLVAAPDLVRWRWAESRNSERWVSSDRTRHMFARLWWQALTFADAGLGERADFTLLNSLSERALNQLTERRSIGGLPHLARALARLEIAEDGPTGGGDGSQLRRLAPILIRRMAFIDFSSLSEEQIDDQLRAIRAEAETLLTPGSLKETPENRSSSSGVSVRQVAPARESSPPSPSARLDGGDGRALTFVDLCAGAGGLAQGLESVGFKPLLLLDNRAVACETLRINRPSWDVEELDLLEFRTEAYPDLAGVDLVSAGLPRVRSAATASRPRGDEEEFALIDAAVTVFLNLRGRALLIDNVPALADSEAYADVRRAIGGRLYEAGFDHEWFVVNAAEFGVPQHRPHGVLVAMERRRMEEFVQPSADMSAAPTVAAVLRESMTAGGWSGVDRWAEVADRLAPTIVGGSWDRGGADLGPSGSKRAWADLGIDGGTVADDVPGPDFRWDPAEGRPGQVRLTVPQVALLQGVPTTWRIAGRKTAQYRQVAEAMPPPLAAALGRAVATALAVS